MWTIWALVLGVGFAIYLPGLAGPFVFDDLRSIPGNDALRAWATPLTVLSGGENNTLSGRPFLALTFAIGESLHPGWPPGHRIANVLLHAGASSLLLVLVLRLVRERGWTEREARLTALVAGSLWLLHPLGTQAVTYIVQRGETLVGLLALTHLLALHTALRRESPRPAAAGLAWAACLLAMLTKESAAALPILGILFDRAVCAPSWAALFRSPTRWLVHGGCIATWLPLALLITSTDGRSGTVGFDLPQTMGAASYALHQLWVVPTYLQLLVWPHPLILHYGPVPLPAWPWLALGASVLAALAAAFLYGLARLPWLALLIGWYLGILAPSSSFVPINDVIFQHRPHVSNAAAAVAAALVLAHVARRRRWTALTVAVTGAAALATATALRNRDYATAEGLWLDTTRHAPSNPKAWLQLGLAQADAGRANDALASLTRALTLDPADYEAFAARGTILLNTGRPHDALRDLERAQVLRPGHFQSLLNRGLAYAALGDHVRAVEDFTACLRVNPSQPQTLNNRAISLVRLGRAEDALRDWTEAVGVAPDYAEGWVNRGQFLWMQGRLDEARSDLKRAVELNPAFRRLLPPGYDPR